MSNIAVKLPSKQSIEIIIGFEISRGLEIYQNAFVHKSAMKESGMNSNERLEYMGDAVLNMVVANYLYNKYPDEDEGFLTKMRTKVVEGKKLAELAKLLKMNELVVMNEKALRNEWNNNPRILEDVLESLIGSMFLVEGIAVTENFILRIIDEFVNSEDILKDKNFKDMLSKYFRCSKIHIQGQCEYKITCSNNNESQKFTTQILIDSKSLGEGTGKTKKESEQNAAKRVLKTLGQLNDY